MSRKHSFAQISIARTAADHVYGSTLVSKLINGIMRDGKKSIAEDIVYEAMDIMKEETSEDPLKMLVEAFENIRPLIEVRSRRIGGATYQIPTDVRQTRSFSLALRWIIASSRARKDLNKNRKLKVMSYRLAYELIAAYKSDGASFKRKENLMKTVEANRAFMHLASR